MATTYDYIYQAKTSQAQTNVQQLVQVYGSYEAALAAVSAASQQLTGRSIQLSSAETAVAQATRATSASIKEAIRTYRQQQETIEQVNREYERQQKALKNTGAAVRQQRRAFDTHNFLLLDTSRIIQDASQFQFGFAQGLRSTANNIAPLIQSYALHRAATLDSQKATLLLRRSLQVMIAVDVASTLFQIAQGMGLIEKRAESLAESVSKVTDSFFEVGTGGVTGAKVFLEDVRSAEQVLEGIDARIEGIKSSLGGSFGGGIAASFRRFVLETGSKLPFVGLAEGLDEILADLKIEESLRDSIAGKIKEAQVQQLLVQKAIEGGLDAYQTGNKLIEDRLLELRRLQALEQFMMDGGGFAIANLDEQIRKLRVKLGIVQEEKKELTELQKARKENLRLSELLSSSELGTLLRVRAQNKLLQERLQLLQQITLWNERQRRAGGSFAAPAAPVEGRGPVEVPGTTDRFGVFSPVRRVQELGRQEAVRDITPSRLVYNAQSGRYQRVDSQGNPLGARREESGPGLPLRDLSSQTISTIQADYERAVRAQQRAIDEMVRGADAVKRAWSGALGSMGDLAEEVFTLMGEKNKAFFILSKGAAIASAIMNTHRAATLALASVPPPYNLAAAKAVRTAGYIDVGIIAAQTIAGLAGGGGGGAGFSAGGGGASVAGGQAAPITTASSPAGFSGFSRLGFTTTDSPSAPGVSARTSYGAPVDSTGQPIFTSASAAAAGGLFSRRFNQVTGFGRIQRPYEWGLGLLDLPESPQVTNAGPGILVPGPPAGIFRAATSRDVVVQLRGGFKITGRDLGLTINEQASLTQKLGGMG